MTPTGSSSTSPTGRAPSGTPSAPDVLQALRQDARVVPVAVLERLLDGLDRL